MINFSWDNKRDFWTNVDLGTSNHPSAVGVAFYLIIMVIIAAVGLNEY